MAGFRVIWSLVFKLGLVTVDSDDKSGLTFRCATFSSPPTPATTNSQALCANLISKMRPLKILGLTLGIGAGLYLLFILFLVSGPYVDNYLSRTDFDSEKWKKWEMTEDEMTLRWDMVDDLQDGYKLDGMTEQEIIELLGEPGAKSKVEWTYDLGMARHGIDTGTLSLTFENGKVKTHRIRTG